jgi:hypothetical protein
MSGTVAHKLLTILILAIVARVPIPWVHCHDDVEATQLSAHLSASHPDKLELPDGWHLHFLIPGLGFDGDHENGIPGDSKDAPKTPDSYQFCETESESEELSKLGYQIVVSDVAFAGMLLDLQAGSVGTRENARTQSEAFAESGQWRYALSVLLI